MAATRRVGVLQLVDQQDRGTALERGIEVEFLERASAMFDRLARQQLQAIQQYRRVVAPVRLDHADDHIQSLRAQAPRLR